MVASEAASGSSQVVRKRVVGTTEELTKAGLTKAEQEELTKWQVLTKAERALFDDELWHQKARSSSTDHSSVQVVLGCSEQFEEGTACFCDHTLHLDEDVTQAARGHSSFLL